MADMSAFTIIPAPRCCWIVNRSPLQICNRPAHWMPLIATVDVTPFWCDVHKQPGATAIAGVTIVRRVSVVAQIVLCSAVESDLLGRAEALARLDRGVQSVGGIFSLHTVHSRTGPWNAPRRAGKGNGNGEAGKG